MLGQEQIDFYHEQGWLGVEDVLGAEDVAALRRVTEEFVEKSRAVRENDDVYDLEPGHSAAEPRLRRLKEPVAAHPLYDRIMRPREYSGDCVAADWAESAAERHEAEHEVAGIWQPGGVAPGLGVLPAHE